jgi:hypothetical protein
MMIKEADSKWKIVVFSILTIAFLPAALNAKSPTLNAPEFSHESGIYNEDFKLAISHDLSDASIFYTLDGSIPDPENLNGSSFLYRESNLKQVDFVSKQITYKTINYKSPIEIKNINNNVNFLSAIQSSIAETESVKETQVDQESKFSNAFSYLSSKIISIWHSFKQLLIEYHLIEIGKFKNIPQVVEVDKGNSLQNEYADNNILPKSIVVRAVAIDAAGRRSPVITKNFYVDKKKFTKLPFVFVTTPSKNLIDYEQGLLVPGIHFDQWRAKHPEGKIHCRIPANWNAIDTQHAVHVEFIDGKNDHAKDGSLTLHGSCSKFYPNKSFRLSFEKKGFKLKLGNLEKDSYRSLILRNAGNDNQVAFIRDVLIQDLAENLNVETQKHMPVILMVNGEYFGIRYVQQRYDRHYFKRRYDISRDDYDHISGWFNSKAGNLKAVTILDDLMVKDNFSDADYLKFKELADHSNFIDYFILNIFANNTDWPGGNFDFWRYSGKAGKGPYLDGRWRWLVYDTDYGLGLVNDHNFNSLILNKNRTWVKNLFHNEVFIQEFVTRFSDLLNHELSADVTLNKLRKLSKDISKDMPLHTLRWEAPKNPQEWRSNLNVISTYLADRPAIQFQHIQETFGLNSPIKLDIVINNIGDDCIDLNTIKLCKSHLDSNNKWSGRYFSNFPLKLILNENDLHTSKILINGKPIQGESIKNMKLVGDTQIQIDFNR